MKTLDRNADTMYLAEFAHMGTEELAAELFIDTPSEKDARVVARDYAENWGFELFSISQANERQLRLHRLRAVPQGQRSQAELLV